MGTGGGMRLGFVFAVRLELRLISRNNCLARDEDTKYNRLLQGTREP